jgi:hypothetical protein
LILAVAIFFNSEFSILYILHFFSEIFALLEAFLLWLY